MQKGNLSSYWKQVCWDAQRSDAAEVERLLVNYNWDTKPPWTRGFFHLSRITAHLIHQSILLRRISSCSLTQEWFFSAWLCYRGPWRPPVMLSGKRGFCSKMSFSSSLGIWMKSSQHNLYNLCKNTLAYIGVYRALLCIVFIEACSVNLIVKTGFVIASASDTPAICYCFHEVVRCVSLSAGAAVCKGYADEGWLLLQAEKPGLMWAHMLSTLSWITRL